MSLIKIATKGAPLTCDELDNNFDYVNDLSNSTGQLDCSRIDPTSLSTCLNTNSVVVGLRQDIAANALAIGQVSQDVIDTQTSLQASISNLTNLVNQQNAIISSLNTQVTTLSNGFTALQSTVSSFDSRLLTIEGRTSTLEAAIAAGIIVVWSGLVANIPAGWSLCSGANGTPDLRDRFIVGAGGSYNVNTGGGSASHNHTVSGTTALTAITTDQMPAHNHNYSDPGHNHGVFLPAPLGSTVAVNDRSFGNYGAGSGAGLGPLGDRVNQLVGISNNTTGITISSQGGGAGHSHSLSVNSDSKSNLPPYYALAYIMKI